MGIMSIDIAGFLRNIDFTVDSHTPGNLWENPWLLRVISEDLYLKKDKQTQFWQSTGIDIPHASDRIGFVALFQTIENSLHTSYMFHAM